LLLIIRCQDSTHTIWPVDLQFSLFLPLVLGEESTGFLGVDLLLTALQRCFTLLDAIRFPHHCPDSCVELHKDARFPSERRDSCHGVATTDQNCQDIICITAALDVLLLAMGTRTRGTRPKTQWQEANLVVTLRRLYSPLSQQSSLRSSPSTFPASCCRTALSPSTKL
jgi:hypothetical protein